MIPMFTAQSALETNGGQHATLPRAVYAAGVVAQQMRLQTLAPDGLGNELAPATCTCPCCQVVGGRLICC